MELTENDMRYLMLGFFGIWVFYAYGVYMSEEIKLGIQLFTIAMFWIYGMQVFSKKS